MLTPRPIELSPAHGEDFRDVSDDETKSNSSLP